MTTQPSSSSMDSLDLDVSHNDGENPAKRQRMDSQGSDSYTPTTKRLLFDFWADEEGKSDSEPSLDEEMPMENTIIQIQDLTKDNCANSRLKFRCSYKGELRRTPKSAYFLFHGRDETSEIGFKAFGNAAEQFYSQIEVNQVYSADGFIVNEETKGFLSTTNHKFHVIMLENSILTRLEDDGTIPELDFNFVKIETVVNTPAKSKIDVLGIIVKKYAPDTTSKGQRKRDIAITDAMHSTVNVTVWGSTAENFDPELFSVLAIRKGKVSEWQGMKSISVSDGCSLWVNPNTAEAAALTEWFENARQARNKKN